MNVKFENPKKYRAPSPILAGGNGIQFNFNFAGSGIVLGLGSLKLSFAPSAGSGQVGDELHIDNFDPNNPTGTCSIDTFQFRDCTLSLQDILDIGMDVSGTALDDFIQGTGMNERISALAGDDTVMAAGGDNDTIKAGSALFVREANRFKAVNDSHYQPFFERRAA